jgi:heme exporter protein D
VVNKKRKWLGYAVVVTGVIVVLLLIYAVNSEPLVRWFENDKRSITWEDILGMGLISLFILALLVSHMALVVVAASSLSESRAPAIKRQAVCPQCERSIQGDWRLCPYCGHKLDIPSAR